MSNIKEYLLQLFFPPVCAMCGRLTEPDTEKHCFCPACRAVWEQEKAVPCPVCRRPAESCSCRVKYNKSRTADSMHSVVLYSSKNVKKTVNRLKTVRDDALIEFFARELEMLIFRRFDMQSGECIMAYPNRSRAALRKYGFDHARLIAEQISEDLEIPLFYGIVNRRGAEQKKLSAAERGQNAYQSYAVKREMRDQLKGKRVIFIDDVITSGATAVTAAALCKMCGAVSVDCFSVARTPL